MKLLLKAIALHPINTLYLGRKVKDKIFTKLQKSKGRDKLVKPLGTPSPKRR